MIFRKESAGSADARALLEELNAVLTVIVGNNGTRYVNYEEFGHEKAAFIIGYDEGKPVCCAGLRPENESTAEIKRVYARKNSIGAGAQLMAELERQARAYGYTRLVLECRSSNPHAIAFYEKNGYTVCGNYPPYVGAADAVCMEKFL